MKNNRTTQICHAFTFGLLLLLAFSLTGANISLARNASDTLVIGIGRDFFDGPDSRSWLHGSTHTWEALTYSGDGFQAQPWLAESWYSQENGQAWVFRLRDGVRFHDGRELTADLAKAAIERIAQNPRYDAAGLYRHLVHLEARSRLELVFYLSTPAPAFPNTVAYYSSPIIHPEMFEPDGRLKGLLATGPYRLQSLKAGEQIVLEAFEDYWGPRPAYRKVVFRTLLDARSRVMALRAGEIDVIADVGGILPQQVRALQKDSRITLQQTPVATTHYLLFNCQQPPFNQQPMRHWLAGILNREELVAALVGKAGVVAREPFVPLDSRLAFETLIFEAVSLPVQPVDALHILLHSGTLNRWPYQDLAQMVQARLAEAGVRAPIVIREPGAYYEDLKQGRYHLAIQPNTLMTGDPDFFYSYYVASDGHRHNACFHAEMDELIVQGRQTMDPDQRRKVYRKLAELFAVHLPLLPLYHDVSWYAHGPGVAVFTMDHFFRPQLLDARPVP